MKLNDFLEQVNCKEDDILNYEGLEAFNKIKEKPTNLCFCHNQTDELIKLALSLSHECIRFIKDIKKEYIIDILKNGSYIYAFNMIPFKQEYLAYPAYKAYYDRVIKGRNREQILEILKNAYKNPEEYRETNKKNGYSLNTYFGEGFDHSPIQDEELCLMAVNHNAWNIQYVNNQTEEICKLAVLKDGMELRCVKIQTPEICLIAVKQNKEAIKFVNKNIFEK